MIMMSGLRNLHPMNRFLNTAITLERIMPIAHMKRQIMGREVVVAVTNGKLDFGPWEQIFYGEFDGRRKKRVLVKIIGE